MHCCKEIIQLKQPPVGHDSQAFGFVSSVREVFLDHFIDFKQ